MIEDALCPDSRGRLLTIVEVNAVASPYRDGDYAEKWNPQSRYQFVVEPRPSHQHSGYRGPRVPYWPQIETVDISLADDVPRVLEVFKAIQANFVIGKIVMAEEFRRANDLHTVHSFEQSFGEIPVTFEPHTQFKLRVPWRLA